MNNRLGRGDDKAARPGQHIDFGVDARDSGHLGVSEAARSSDLTKQLLIGAFGLLPDH